MESSPETNPDLWVDEYGDALFGFAMARVKDREAERDQASTDPLSIQVNSDAVQEKAAGRGPEAAKAKAPGKDREKGEASVDVATRVALRPRFLKTNR